MNTMSDNGADIIELGIPFSDPVADGPVIEEASKKALLNGFKVSDIIDIIRQTDKISLYLMGYFNSFYNKGFEYFFDKKFDNLKGLVIPDLSYEESLSYLDIFDKYNKSLVSFVTPLSNENRIKTIIKNARGFIYLVAYAGVTGGGKDTNLDDIIKNIREYSKTPIYIGFGVNEANAKNKSKNIDGVIVATYIMKIILDESISYDTKTKKIATICKNIKNEINS
jgi:tryptophan synthase alpha chain